MPNHTLLDAETEQAIRDFVEGAASGDCKRMEASRGALGTGGGWPRAMRGASLLRSIPRKTQAYFLRVYLKDGHEIRGECDDLALIAGLRILLPSYDGPTMRLYRGEDWRNHERRRYGASWTASVDVARRIADSPFHRMSAGGSVVLEVLAPQAAIICAPALLGNKVKEKEYILDRRRLTSVKVLERFSQLAPEEMQKALASERGGAREPQHNALLLAPRAACVDARAWMRYSATPAATKRRG